MKCVDCNCYEKGWFPSKPDKYVCIGVKEPFVIDDINAECTEYSDDNKYDVLTTKIIPYESANTNELKETKKMKAKLIIEGKEFPIEISDPELQKLLVPTKKTGYKRVDREEKFYYGTTDGDFVWDYDYHNDFDNKIYDAANYYSDEAVAENNTRADRLMRQLRRFAVEHRENEINWNDEAQCKYYIYSENSTNDLKIDYIYVTRYFGYVYFDTEEAANLAIKTFHDELIWYFTEYKDSL